MKRNKASIGRSVTAASQVPLMYRPDSGIYSTITGLLLLAWCLPAAALEVYRWTDAQGIVQFSEAPPADPQIPFQTLQLEYTGSSIVPNRVNNVLRVARHLEASRLAREQARTEAHQAAQEVERQVRLAEEQATPAPATLYPGYYPRPFYPHPLPPRHMPAPRWVPPPGYRPPRPPAVPTSDPAVAWGGRR